MGFKKNGGFAIYLACSDYWDERDNLSLETFWYSPQKRNPTYHCLKGEQNYSIGRWNYEKHNP